MHRKAAALMEPMEAMARVASLAAGRAESAQTRASGSASYGNGDGTRTIVGPQAGGRGVATHVGDETPPGRPLGVAGASSAGVVYVAWGGELEGGTPADFDRVSCWMTVAGTDQLVGTLTEAGIVSTVPMRTTASVAVWATAEDDACLADGTPAHNVSARSDAAAVTVTQSGDEAALDALRRAVAAAQGRADAAMGAAEAVARTRALLATCGTAAASAGKVAALSSGTMALSAGASVSVVFSEANVAASPTLDVGGTGARPIMANGAPYAYWAAGQAVTLVYDGEAWQVCSVPVYASTVTVGDPGGASVRIDPGSVGLREGGDTVASFSRGAISLGGGSSSISMAGDAMRIDAMPAHALPGGGKAPLAVQLSVPAGQEDGASVGFVAEGRDSGHVSDIGFGFSWGASGGGRMSVIGDLSVSGDARFGVEAKTWFDGLQAWRTGGVVTISLHGKLNFPSEWSTALAVTLPEGWRPPYPVYAPIGCNNQTAAYATRMAVGTDGKVECYCAGGRNPGGGEAWYGHLTYVATR